MSFNDSAYIRTTSKTEKSTSILDIYTDTVIQLKSDL